MIMHNSVLPLSVDRTGLERMTDTLRQPREWPSTSKYKTILRK